MKALKKSEVLYATIKKEFFDQIINGQKTEEYREPSDYWVRRLMQIENGTPTKIKPFKYIRLCVGYHTNREEALIEIKDIYLAIFKKLIPEGFEKGDKSFVIELGKVINHKLKENHI